MSKVTLVFPRFKYSSGDFSLGLAYIAAYLKREIGNIEINLIDTTFNPNIEFVSEQIGQCKPDIVGIYMDTLMYEDGLKVAKVAKSQSAFVVVGGPHASILPQTVINNKYVDVVCVGEGEETFREIVQEFFGDRRMDRIKGIWHKKNGAAIQNPPRNPIENLDSLPFPDMDIFDVERYIKNFIQLDSYNPKIRGLSVIVSRGCPFRCSYCQPTLTKILGKKFRIRSPQNVIQELKTLKKKYDIDAFYFQDDTLTASRKWILEFCELIILEKLDFVWACNTRADIIDREMLEKMHQAGLVKVKVGIEAISDRVRNGIYGKGITSSHIDRIINNTKELGIQATGFFMLGAPTETKQEIVDTIKFAVKSDLKEANFSIAVPFPSTDLYELAKEKDWLLPEKFSDYDYYHAIRPPFTKDDISSKKLQFYKQIAYLSFYLHPKRARNTLRSVWGMETFKKTIQKIRRF